MMGVERELKCRLAPQAARAVPQHPLLLLAGGARTRELQTWYFDTESGQLAERGMVLRVRQDGARRVLTVKTRGLDALGAERGEWEWDALDSPACDQLGPRDLDHALRHTALSALTGKSRDAAALHAALRARFGTRFERSSWDLAWQGARIELALDRGECLALGEQGLLTSPLCELELEILQGDLAHAWDLAWTLAQDLPLLLSPVDKARRAASLLTRDGPRALPEPGALPRDATLQRAARLWLQTACAQLAVWAERIEHADDARNVHQLRVVLRRLRTALRWLRPHLPRQACDWLRGELRWAHQLAGLVRDADVSIELLRRGAAALGDTASAAPARAWSDELQAQRAFQLAALRAYLASPRFARLLLALGRGAELPLRGGAGAQALRATARRALRRDQRQWRSAMRACEPALREPLRDAGGALDAAQAAWLHALRIGCKRLRLSSDRLAGLLGRSQRESCERAARMATALQTYLGDWHDAERLVQRALERSPQAMQLLAWLAAQAGEALRRAAQEAGVAPPKASRHADAAQPLAQGGYEQEPAAAAGAADAPAREPGDAPVPRDDAEPLLHGEREAEVGEQGRAQAVAQAPAVAHAQAQEHNGQRAAPAEPGLY